MDRLIDEIAEDFGYQIFIIGNYERRIRISQHIKAALIAYESRRAGGQQTPAQGECVMVPGEAQTKAAAQYLQLPPLTDIMYNAVRGSEYHFGRGETTVAGHLDDDCLDQIWDNINTALRTSRTPNVPGNELDLAMMIRRLTVALAHSNARHPIINQAKDLLKRFGLEGSPLR